MCNLDNYKLQPPPEDTTPEETKNFDYAMNSVETHFYKAVGNGFAVSVCIYSGFEGIHKVGIDIMQDEDIEETTKEFFDAAFTEARDVLEGEAGI